MLFFDALLEHGFLQNALLAAALSSLASGIVGAWVVVRRSASIAGAIAHCVLAGLGAARWLQVNHGLTWAEPMAGAIVAAVLAAVVISFATRRNLEREDTVIASIWAVGMAVGVLFIARTPGYAEDLMSYLFGNILLVGRDDLMMMAGLDVLVVVAAVVFFAELQCMCFDEEFARLRGLPVQGLSLLLHVLTALTVVLLVSVVGIVLVIALLTLPAAVAGRFAATLAGTMALAVVLSLLLTTLGLAVSFASNLPSGATTIVLAGGLYLVSLLVRRR